MTRENQSKDIPAITERLLGEFESPTYDEWRLAAEKSLKGAPFEKKLFTETCEGIVLKPVYNESDARGLKHLGGLPGFSPYVRGIESMLDAGKPWEVCQEISCAAPAEVNEALIHELGCGQNAARVALDRAGRRCADPDVAPKGTVGSGGVSIIAVDDLSLLLKGIDPSCPLYLQAGCAGTAIAAMLFSHARASGADLKKLAGCIENDPLGALASTGALPRSPSVLYDEIAALTRWTAKHAPAIRTVAVNANHYHDAGCSAVQELAFALATGVEYVRELLARELSMKDIAGRILFELSVGPKFFMEAAKLRAARLVWARAIEAFGGDDADGKMFIHVRTSAWSSSALDPYVNMLRGTTEAFSAAVGGANGIQTSPFDEAIRRPDGFSRRIARNVQSILKDESRLGQVIDPAGGSWYVECLTDQIASKSWALFQEMEKEGGMAKALVSGLPQKLASATASERARDLATRKSTIVGTNIYPNLKEKPLEQGKTNLDGFAAERGREAAKLKAEADRNNGVHRTIEKLTKLAGTNSTELFEAAVQAAAAGATLSEICEALTPKTADAIEIEPLRIHRASEKHEKLREATAKHAVNTGARPRVFLANMGPVPQHKARADFSTGFFEVGGFEVLGNEGFKTPEDAAEAAAGSGAEIAVICSTDETYPELVPRFATSLKRANVKTKVILAGYPKDQIEGHKAAGVEEFIHLKADNYEILAGLLREIGVEL